MDTDPNRLHPSVEAFLAKVKGERHRRSGPTTTTIQMHGDPRMADALALTSTSGCLSIHMGGNQRVDFFCERFSLASDLADAINTVLAAHAQFASGPAADVMTDRDPVDTRRAAAIASGLPQAGDRARQAEDVGALS